MTHCPSEDILLDYVAGALAPAQAAGFERHAKECSRCDALVASQASVWRSLDEWKPEPVSAEFNRELWRRIDADAAAPSWTARLHFWKQLAPLAALLALVATGFVMDHHSQPPAAAPASVAVSASEADQLERTLDDLQLLEAVDTATPARPAADLM